MRFRLHVLAAAVFAVALQLQTTLPIGEAGIRAAASDLLLPVALGYVAIGLLMSAMRLEWRISGVVWWLVAITASMTVATFVGYSNLGFWSSWAMVNKFGGWFALLSYFLVGTAIVRYGGDSLRDRFLTTFLTTAAFIAALNMLAFPWLLKHYTLPFGIEFSRASGAMQNSNAFGFLLVVASILIVARGRDIRFLLPPVLAGLWFTSSRGALLAIVVAALVFLFLSRRHLLPTIRPAVTAVVAIVLVTGISFAVYPALSARIQSGQSSVGLVSAERIGLIDGTIHERSAQNARALDLIAAAPLFGHGLGYFVATVGTTLHNSLLWLILELGLIGAIPMVGFLGTAVYSFYLGREDAFLLGMVIVAVAFAVMSATGEYLYQRHLWLLLGMAMAKPAAGPRGS